MSQAWRAMGDHGFGVREVTGLKSRGNPPFLKVSVPYEIGKKHQVQLGLILPPECLMCVFTKSLVRDRLHGEILAQSGV